MSVKSGFFNSKNHDRRYDTRDISTMFEGIVEDGVYMHVGEALKVKPGTGMSVNVGSGRSWFNLTYTRNDSDFPIPLEAADVLLDRIDVIVNRVDLSDSVRNNTLIVIKGTPATEPKVPELAKGPSQYDYALAEIRVRANVTEIKSEDIKDTRGSDACPWVTAPLTAMSVESLTTQWQAEFERLITELQDRLDQVTQGKIPDGSVSSNFKITIPKDGWTTDDDDIRIELSFPGIHEKDDPFTRPEVGTVDTKDEIWSTFSDIWKIETFDNRIIVHSNAVPAIPITVNFKCVRK